MFNRHLFFIGLRNYFNIKKPSLNINQIFEKQMVVMPTKITEKHMYVIMSTAIAKSDSTLFSWAAPR